MRTLLLSLALSLVGVALVLFWFGQPEDVGRLLELPLWSVLLGICSLLTNYLCGSLRLVMLTRIVGKPVGLWRAARAYLFGLFSKAVTPSGSGNLPAVVLSLVRDGLPAATAWSVTLYTSILDLFFFALSVPFALALVSADAATGHSPLWAALPIGGFFLAFAYVLAYHITAFTRGVAVLFSIKPLKRWQRPAIRSTRKLTATTGTVTRAPLLERIALFILTALLHTAMYLILYIFLKGLGASLPLLPTLAVIQLATVVSFVVPTPGGSGFIEVAVSYGLSRESQSSVITPAVVAWRAFGYYSIFLIGPALGGTLLRKTGLETFEKP